MPADFQFVAMLFCQLGRAHSLREICGGLACCEGKLTHLGIRVPKRSTLSYANEHRPWQLYEQIFYRLLDRCRIQTMGVRRKPFRFKNPLLSLDSTVIDLCASLFDWARFRTTKGAVKLHLLLDHDGYLPSFARITEGIVSDLTIGRSINIPPGSILAIDRGYTDYEWFADLTQQGIFFVTRLKSNADIWVLNERPVSGEIIRDNDIRLWGLEHKGRHEVNLRIVEIDDPEQGRLVFLTNHLKLSAHTIAAIYKDRWQIDSSPVAGEAPWRESKMVKPSDKLFRKEMMQGFRPQRTVNVEVASLHANPVAETVDNVRRQQEPFEMSPKRRFSPAGYQRRHAARDYVSTGEALGTRQGNLVEEALPITVSGKWESRCQGGGLGCSTVDRCAAKHTGRKGPRPVSIPFDCREAVAR